MPGLDESFYADYAIQGLMQQAREAVKTHWYEAKGDVWLIREDTGEAVAHVFSDDSSELYVLLWQGSSANRSTTLHYFVDRASAKAFAERSF